jgi:uncharacterized protein YcbK (DUF882 family)
MVGRWSRRARLATDATRRDLLRWGALALGAACVPKRAWAARDRTVRSVSLYSVHTGESLRADYCVDGHYQDDVLRQVAWVLRDHRTDQVHPIDPEVLDVLGSVRAAVASSAPFHVVCGYRSPETNALRHLESPRSVAVDSFHIYGRAVDVYLPQRDLRQLRRAALALGAGGVGYYPRSGFVHLDNGPSRTW